MTSNTITDAATRDALFKLLARLADNKYFLGRWYAEWCSGAPTLESAVAAAAMAQDELGHARAIYPLLRTLTPKAGPEIEPESRTHFTNLRFLDTSFSGWEDFVTANFLIDTALSLIFEAAKASTYEPLAGRSRKVLQEERTHALHGEAWTRRLARSGRAARAASEASMRRAWGEILCWFGPQGGAGDDDPLSAAGILDATPDALRQRYLAVVGPTIAAEQLDLPVRRAGDDGANNWELTAPLPWDRWNAADYRFTAADDAPVPLVASGASETQQS